MERLAAYARLASSALVFRRGDRALDELVHTVTVEVRNKGERYAGRTSLLCYVVPPQGAAVAGLPQRTLVDFAKTPDLLPEQSATISFGITAHDLTVTPPGGGRVTLRGDWHVEIGGGGVSAPQLMATVKVV